MSSSDPRISHAKLQAPSPSRIDDMNYGMPDFKRVLTTIDDKGQSIFVQANDSRRYCDRGGYSVTFNYVTGEFPLGMQGDIDLEGFLTNDPRSPTSYIHTGKRIVNDHGMTFNTINFGPGVQTSMHRTVSVDFIAVIEGDVALELDSGESQHLATGVSHAPVFVRPAGCFVLPLASSK